MQYYELFTQSDLELIHENVLDILEKTGIAFYHEPAQDIFCKSGCRLEGSQFFCVFQPGKTTSSAGDVAISKR